MYKVLKINRFETVDHYILIPVRKEDLEGIREWRNAQLDILRQKQPISSEEQIKYYENNVFPTFHFKEPQQILFSFLHQEECIGYGGLTNIDWQAKRAEVSFLLNPQRSPDMYAKEFIKFLELLKEVAFDVLQLEKLFTETYSFRKNHIAILEKFGFKHEGILKNHVFKKGHLYDSYFHALFKEGLS